jgi:hypothetical protein
MDFWTFSVHDERAVLGYNATTSKKSTFNRFFKVHIQSVFKSIFRAATTPSVRFG